MPVTKAEMNLASDRELTELTQCFSFSLSFSRNINNNLLDIAILPFIESTKMTETSLRLCSKYTLNSL